MSEFKVEIVKIDEVIKHPNADRLTIIKIKGYDCISSLLDDGSYRYNAGDLVAYIPEASVVPEWILKHLGFWDDTKNKGILAGASGNRVKAIKLRGVVSQGILYPVHKVPVITMDVKEWDLTENIIMLPMLVHGNEVIGLQQKVELGDDVAEALGITKYEPPIPTQLAGKVGSLFGYTKSYDIENIQNYPDVFKDGESVVMTEKLHGTLCQIGFLNNLPEDKKEDVFHVLENTYAFVTSKGQAGKGLVQKNTEDNDGNLYVKAYKEHFAHNRVETLQPFFSIIDLLQMNPNSNLYIFGEIYGPGVQTGYNYNKAAPDFRVFDIYVKDYVTGEGYYLNSLELTNFCIKTGLKRVPILYTGPFSLQIAKEIACGTTVEGNGKHIREGAVIRPFEEQYQRGLPDNRKQLKIINPEYLAKTSGEEFN